MEAVYIRSLYGIFVVATNTSNLVFHVFEEQKEDVKTYDQTLYFWTR